VRLYTEACQTSPCSSPFRVWRLVKRPEEGKRGARKQRIRGKDEEEKNDNKREQGARG
jgi:hypothetical protein